MLKNKVTYVPYKAFMGDNPTFIKQSKDWEKMFVYMFTKDCELAATTTDIDVAQKVVNVLGGNWKVYTVKKNLKEELEFLK